MPLIILFLLLISSTCFGHYYAHHHVLATIMLITTLVVSFLVCCRLEVRCGQAGLVSGLQAIARLVVLQPAVWVCLALLNLSGNYIYTTWFGNKTVHFTHTVYLCVKWYLCVKCHSDNKKRYIPTPFNNWSFYWRHNRISPRHELQTRFTF